LVIAALVLLLVPSGLGAPTSGTSAQRVRITSLTAAVLRGQSVSLRASVVPRTARCSGTARPASGGATVRLAAKRARRGVVAWSFRVPATAAPGRWVATVSCGRAGRASRSFAVTRAAVPAQVEVERSGFTQASIGDFRTVSIGLVLVNRSADEAALDTDVTINLVDASDRVIETHSYSVDYIPAGGRFFFGQPEFVQPTVARLELAVRVARSQVESRPVLNAENVRVTEDFGGDAQAVGELRNTTDMSLSPVARISAVAFDASGRVIGGGRNFPEAAVPPGFRVGFTIDLDPLRPNEIASVETSVESAFSS
jgi:hypothetical protein